MPDVKLHRCIRCGIEVYQQGAACVDCLSTDRGLVNAWRTPPAPRPEVVRPPDCTEPSAGAMERHRWRGEMACRACVDHKNAQKAASKARSETKP